MEANLIVDSFVPGKKMMICPHQDADCKYGFPAGDGAFLICTYEHCLELKDCIIDVEERERQEEREMLYQEGILYEGDDECDENI